ncbi:hypothetical protein CEXT_7971 [Caerostris extrusa]|uniref:Uncharacterized protein n=1 Tax=Caerostris extrusa TaxID=172846 RepID=A0AAV4XLD8_CAEEX|nr:hypothetical protein CEXT_7971 [Caerostris extrusa]
MDLISFGAEPVLFQVERDLSFDSSSFQSEQHLKIFLNVTVAARLNRVDCQQNNSGSSPKRTSLPLIIIILSRRCFLCPQVKPSGYHEELLSEYFYCSFMMPHSSENALNLFSPQRDPWT